MTCEDAIQDERVRKKKWKEERREEEGIFLVCSHTIIIKSVSPQSPYCPLTSLFASSDRITVCRIVCVRGVWPMAYLCECVWGEKFEGGLEYKWSRRGETEGRSGKLRDKPPSPYEKNVWEVQVPWWLPRSSNPGMRNGKEADSNCNQFKFSMT